MSLADAMVRRQGRAQDRLERLSALLDWSAIEAVLGAVQPSRIGAPGYRALTMLRALLLQQWYDLSDPELEDALSDRLSFRRFVGLALDEATPDHSTISRFRGALVAHGLTGLVFAEVVRQIDAKGFILRRGTMVDATLVEAAVKRPPPPRTDSPAADIMGEESAAADVDGRAPSKLVLSPTDPDATWAKKGYQRFFGYKGHVASIWVQAWCDAAR